MSPKLSLKSSPPKILHSDSVTDDKRLKRMEREKQREEQRKKREERRKQRDEQKFARVQKQSSGIYFICDKNSRFTTCQSPGVIVKYVDIL